MCYTAGLIGTRTLANRSLLSVLGRLAPVIGGLLTLGGDVLKEAQVTVGYNQKRQGKAKESSKYNTMDPDGTGRADLNW